MTPAAKMITVVENNTRRLNELATTVFSNEQKAARWINEPNPSLDYRRPLDVVETEEGYEAVRDVLTRIESGTYS